ncbi:DsbE family thiol:disulfide interchange protein [Vitreimonas flagellata]|uniref:DsbE family thiol:disulfide interchange protein n=1 Tax=Vitreimonas flagellata TaxID=2560861 RepID=UPI001074F819|nr:DsbE family thiol:disulfide interchange protein [Vitreimonas flagellata]
MKRFIAFAPLILLALLVVVGAVMLTRGGERELFTTGEAGRVAPTFALSRLDGGAMLTSDEMAGRAYVINMFASWCTPCRAEHPQLMALRERGVEIVGVAYKDQPEASARFLQELGDPFRVVALDPDGRFGIELGIAGVPETFVIGPDGTIRAAYRGPLTPEVVENTILPALEAAD